MTEQERVYNPKEEKQILPEDFNDLGYNPSHPGHKQRSLRQLSSTERL